MTVKNKELSQKVSDLKKKLKRVRASLDGSRTYALKVHDKKAAMRNKIWEQASKIKFLGGEGRECKAALINKIKNMEDKLKGYRAQIVTLKKQLNGLVDGFVISSNHYKVKEMEMRTTMRAVADMITSQSETQ